MVTAVRLGAKGFGAHWAGEGALPRVHRHVVIESRLREEAHVAHHALEVLGPCRVHETHVALAVFEIWNYTNFTTLLHKHSVILTLLEILNPILLLCTYK